MYSQLTHPVLFSVSQKGTSTALNPSSRQRRADTGVWPCTLDGCSKVFAREADLKRHQRTTKSHLVPGSGVGSPCPLCEATFTRTDAMRRHLKSRHNGKTPETLHLPDTQTASSSSSKGKRRARTPSDTSEFSASDGEQQPEPGPSCSSSRAQSVAPPYYEQEAHPAPQPSNNLSPAVLYQAALSYEIQHALSPTSSPSSPSVAGVHSPTTSAMRTENGDDLSPRMAFHHPPEQEQQFAHYPEHYAYHHNNHHSQYVEMSQTHPHSHPYPPSPDRVESVYTNGVFSQGRGPESPSYESQAWSPGGTVKLEDADVVMTANHRRRGSHHPPSSPFAQHEPVPSGLAALAMHAARIRPMSPLPSDAKQGTKSELESALGPSYAR